MGISNFLSYTLTRVSCLKCGQFEHGSQGTCIAVCPYCGSILHLEMDCRGMTTKPLPFTTSPRLPGAVKAPKQKQDPNMGIPSGVGEFKPKDAGHQANGKSTGRPRGGHGRGATNYRGEAHSTYRYEGKFVEKDEPEDES